MSLGGIQIILYLQGFDQVTCPRFRSYCAVSVVMMDQKVADHVILNKWPIESRSIPNFACECKLLLSSVIHDLTCTQPLPSDYEDFWPNVDEIKWDFNDVSSMSFQSRFSKSRWSPDPRYHLSITGYLILMTATLLKCHCKSVTSRYFWIHTVNHAPEIDKDESDFEFKFCVDFE
jgi:hypothetical protein